MQKHYPTLYQPDTKLIRLPVGGKQTHSVDWTAVAGKIASPLSDRTIWAASQPLTLSGSSVSGSVSTVTVQASNCGRYRLECLGRFEDGQIRKQIFDVLVTGAPDNG